MTANTQIKLDDGRWVDAMTVKPPFATAGDEANAIRTMLDDDMMPKRLGIYHQGRLAELRSDGFKAIATLKLSTNSQPCSPHD